MTKFNRIFNLIMKYIRRILINIPLINSAFFFIYRIKLPFTYFMGPIKTSLVWLFISRETTNLTYDLTNRNMKYLASLIADIVGKEYDEIWAYMQELNNDVVLKQHIKNITNHSSEKIVADSDAHFGRRLGWYAFVRAIKPKVVVETGVDKGLGSCVLTAAIIKNKDEGNKGYYYGTDINAEAGYLLSGDYKKYGEVLFGDSISSLNKLDVTIDLFINDSNHSLEYEAKEYKTILNRLSSNAIILSDNAHCTDALHNFALKTKRNFIFFREEPYKHWYSGAGIGIAFNRK